MGLVLQAFLSGITVGSVYALVGLGFTLVYVSTRVLNIAQGEFVMLGGLIMVGLAVSLGVPWPLAFVLAVLAVAGVGAAVERLTIRPLSSHPPGFLLMITIGVMLTLRGVAEVFWGTNPYALPHYFGRTPVKIGEAIILPQAIWVLVMTGLVLLVFYLFLERTMLGRALRACAENKDAASLMGIDVSSIMFVSFAMSAGIGAIGGILVTPLTTMGALSGVMLTLKGVTGAVIGGFDKYTGPVVGGLLLGLIESFSAVFIHGMLKDSIALTVLIVVLLVWPKGIMGRARG